MTDTRRRVKLYALNSERQWDDKGTGHVSSTYVERLQGISLLVRAEVDGSLLLESKIQPDAAYQKQQETLIVWSEGDNFDLALSFQEKAGCDEIWAKICQVQGKDPSVDFTQEIIEESEDERCFDEMSDSVPPVELPPCELNRLEDISELVSSCLPSPIKREKLAVAVENEGYIKKLLNLFHVCEDLENTEGLHHLYEIFKNVFLLNKNALFELMFAEDTIFDVVGCLEFDPSLPAPKRHRQYLKSIATFHQVLPISNPELMSKIHQTYRVQYIQDVVLPTPSVLEENILSTLSSFIFFNKVDIVSQIQEDEKFLTDLFAQLTDEKTEENRRRELVLFLKEFFTFSQTLQPQARESFFKTLSNLGILQALEKTLAAENRQTKSASVDILLFIVEYSPSMVREYMLHQLSSTEDDQLLMNIIIEQMTCDSDPETGSAVQLMGIIRTLLDPENMLASVNKSEKTDFLSFFYKHCTHVLIGPLLANTSNEKVVTNEPSTVQLLSLVLELLSFCVEHHTYQIKNYILQNDLLRRILVLMKSRHTFLVLCALRFMRKIIALKDEFYNRYIIKGNLFAPVVDAFVTNNGRYNLLDSAILEMFEHIKMEDIKSLCTHVVERYGPVLDKISYVQTFKALKQKYDQHMDRQKGRQQPPLENVGSILRPGKFRRDPREVDEEEEMWFNEDDYEDEDSSHHQQQQQQQQHLHHQQQQPQHSPQQQMISQPSASSTPSPSSIGSSPADSPNDPISPGASPVLTRTASGVNEALISSPLAAAAAVAASAGAGVGFCAVVDTVQKPFGMDDDEDEVSASGKGQGTKNNVKRALVDYEGDSDDEEEDSENVEEDDDEEDDEEDNEDEIRTHSAAIEEAVKQSQEAAAPSADDAVTDDASCPDTSTSVPPPSKVTAEPDATNEAGPQSSTWSPGNLDCVNGLDNKDSSDHHHISSASSQGGPEESHESHKDADLPARDGLQAGNRSCSDAGQSNGVVDDDDDVDGAAADSAVSSSPAPAAEGPDDNHVHLHRNNHLGGDDENDDAADLDLPAAKRQKLCMESIQNDQQQGLVDDHHPSS